MMTKKAGGRALSCDCDNAYMYVHEQLLIPSRSRRSLKLASFARACRALRAQSSHATVRAPSQPASCTVVDVLCAGKSNTKAPGNSAGAKVESH